MSEEIAERLRAATRWPDIQRGDESYVVRFDFRDRGSVHGLRTTPTGFALSFPEFASLPIAFLVSHERGTIEYWSVNGRLHRPSGKPALVQWMEDQNYFERRWYWHDVPHRTDGPAIEIGNLAPSAADDGYTRYRWRERQWFVEGVARAAEDGPRKVEERNVTIYHSPYAVLCDANPMLAAYRAEEITAKWSDTERLNLSPRSFTAVKFEEHWPGGEFAKRSANAPTFTWQKRWSKYNDTGCSKWLYENMFNDLNLFEGPFFKNETEEFIAFTEMDRILDAQ